MKTTTLKRNPKITAPIKGLAWFTSWTMLFFPLMVQAADLPTGASVVHGGVDVSTVGKTMNINQSTGKAIVNWDSFDIGSGFSVNVNQPGRQAAMLSRVVGGNPSDIMGALKATGIFYLVNPSGVYFGPNASVNVPELVVSTLNLANDDFLSGNIRFTGDSPEDIVNEGDITGEKVALLAGDGRITNRGQITAGQTALAAGSTVEIGNVGGGALTIDIEGLSGEVVNEGGIDASGTPWSPDGGDVALKADGVANFGEISADGVADGDGGDVTLAGNALISVGDISATGGPDGGDGGFVETSGYEAFVITTAPDVSAGDGGTGGIWLIDPNNIEIVAGGGNTNISGTSPFESSDDTAQLGVDLVTGLLDVGNQAIIRTTSSGTNSQDGDITVSTAINSGGSGNLIFEADDDITVNATIGIAGDLTFDVDYRGLSIDRAFLNLNAGVTAANVSLLTNAGNSINLGIDGTGDAVLQSADMANITANTLTVGDGTNSIVSFDGLLSGATAGINTLTVHGGGAPGIEFINNASNFAAGVDVVLEAAGAGVQISQPVTMGAGGNLTIHATGGDVNIDNAVTNGNNFIIDPPASINVTANVNMAGNIDWQATGNITVQNGATVNSTGGYVTLTADANSIGAGTLQIGPSTSGGSVLAGGGDITLGGEDVHISRAGNHPATVNAGGNDIIVNVDRDNSGSGVLSIGSQASLTGNNFLMNTANDPQNLVVDTLNNDGHINPNVLATGIANRVRLRADGTITITNTAAETFGIFDAQAPGGTVNLLQDLTATNGVILAGANISLQNPLTVSTSNSNILLSGPVALGGAVNLDTDTGAGNVTVQGAITGANSLSIAAGTGDVDLQGLVNNIASLTVAGAANIDTVGITTSGLTSLTAATSVDVAGSASAQSFTVAGGPAQIDLGNVVANGGPINVPGTNIDLNGTNYQANGQNILFDGVVDLMAGPITVTTGGGAAGNVTFTGTINGVQALTLTAGLGDIDLQGAVNNILSLGATAANIGTQAITTTGPTALVSPGNVNVVGDVNAQSFAVAGGATQVDLANVTANGGPINVAGTNIDLNGTNYQANGQNIFLTGAVDLMAGPVAITTGGGGGNITVGTIDGGQALTITAGSGNVALGDVGGVTDLASLAVNSANILTLNDVTTTGTQSYTAADIQLSSIYTGGGITFAGPVTLNDNEIFNIIAGAGTGLAFNSTVATDGTPRDLTVTMTPGLTKSVTFGGQVGAVGQRLGQVNVTANTHTVNGTIFANDITLLGNNDDSVPASADSLAFGFDAGLNAANTITIGGAADIPRIPQIDINDGNLISGAGIDILGTGVSVDLDGAGVIFDGGTGMINGPGATIDGTAGLDPNTGMSFLSDSGINVAGIIGTGNLGLGPSSAGIGIDIAGNDAAPAGAWYRVTELTLAGISDSFSSVTIGKNNSGEVRIAEDVIASLDLSAKDWDLAVIGAAGAGDAFNIFNPINMGDDSLHLEIVNAGNTATQSAGATITADELGISGPGGFNLPEANGVNTLGVAGGATGTYVDAGTLALGTVFNVPVFSSGALTVTTGGDLTQTAPITVGGVAQLNAPGFDILIGNPANDFQAAVQAVANNAFLGDANALDLGASTLAGTMDVRAGTSITNSGPVVGPNMLFVSGAGTNLGNVNNDFTTIEGTASGPVTIRDTNDLLVDTVAPVGPPPVAPVNGIISNGGNVDIATGLGGGSGLLTVNQQISTAPGAGGVLTVGGALINAPLVLGTGDIDLNALAPQGDIVINNVLDLLGGSANFVTTNGGVWVTPAGGITNGNNIVMTGDTWASTYGAPAPAPGGIGVGIEGGINNVVNLDLNSTSAVDIFINAPVSTTGYLDANSARDIIVQAPVNAGSYILATAANDFLSTVTGTMDANANSGAGYAIKIDANGTVTVGGALTATGPGPFIPDLNIDIDPTDVNVNANVTATGNVGITASNNISFANGVVVEADSDNLGGGDLTATADDDADTVGNLLQNATGELIGANVNLSGANVTLSGGVGAGAAAVNAKTGTVDVDANVGNLLYDGPGDILAAVDVLLNASGTVSETDPAGLINAGNTVQIGVAPGNGVATADVDINGEGITAQNGVIIRSTNTTRIGDAAVVQTTTGAGNIEITAGGAMTLEDSASIASAGTAGTSLDIQGATVTLNSDNGAVEVSAAGHTDIDSTAGNTSIGTAGAVPTDLQIAGNATIDAHGADVLQNDGTIQVLGNLQIGLDGNDTVNVTQGADAGDDAIADAIQAATVAISATNDVTLASNSSDDAVEATVGNVDIDAGNNVAHTGSGDIQASNDVLINAVNQVSQTDPVGWIIGGNTVQIGVPANGLATTSADINGAGITAPNGVTITTTGNTRIADAAIVETTGPGDVVVTAGGQIDILNTSIVRTTAAIGVAGDILLTATGAVNLLDQAAISSNGTVNNPNSLDIQGATVTLNSDNGAVEVFAAGNGDIDSLLGNTQIGPADTDLNILGNLTIDAANSDVEQQNGTIVVGGNLQIGLDADGFGPTANFTQFADAGDSTGGSGVDAINVGGTAEILTTNNIDFQSDTDDDALEALGLGVGTGGGYGIWLSAGNNLIVSGDADVESSANDAGVQGIAGNDILLTGTGGIIASGTGGAGDADVVLNAVNAVDVDQNNLGAFLWATDDIFVGQDPANLPVAHPGTLPAGNESVTVDISGNATAGDTIYVDATGAITIDEDAIVSTIGGVPNTGIIDIESSGGTVTVAGTAQILANPLLPTADLIIQGDNISLMSDNGGTELQAGGWAQLWADNGTIQIGTGGADSDVWAADFIHAQATGGIAMVEDSGSRLTSRDAAVTLLTTDAGSNIFTDEIDAGTFIDMTAPGNVEVTGNTTARDGYVYLRGDYDASGAGDVIVRDDNTTLAAFGNDGDTGGIIWFAGENVQVGNANPLVDDNVLVRADGRDADGDMIPGREFGIGVLAQNDVTYNGRLEATNGSIYIFGDAPLDVLPGAAFHGTVVSPTPYVTTNDGLLEIANGGVAANRDGTIIAGEFGELFAPGIQSDIVLNSPEPIVIDNITEAGRNVLAYTASGITVKDASAVGAYHGHITMYADAPGDVDGLVDWTAGGITVNPGDPVGLDGLGDFYMEDNSAMIANLHAPSEGYVEIYGANATLDNIQANGENAIGNMNADGTPATGTSILVKVNNGDTTNPTNIYGRDDLQSESPNADIVFDIVSTDAYGDIVQGPGAHWFSNGSIIFEPGAAPATSLVNSVLLQGDMTTNEAVSIVTRALGPAGGSIPVIPVGSPADPAPALITAGEIAMDGIGTLTIGGDYTLVADTATGGVITQTSGDVVTNVGNINYSAGAIDLSGGTTEANSGYIMMNAATGNLLANALTADTNMPDPMSGSTDIAIKLGAPLGDVTLGGPVVTDSDAPNNLRGLFVDPVNAVFAAPVDVTGNVVAWATNNIDVYAPINTYGSASQIWLRADDDGTNAGVLGAPSGADGSGNLMIYPSAALTAVSGQIDLSGEEILVGDITTLGPTNITADVNGDGSVTPSILYGTILGSNINLNVNNAQVNIMADPENLAGGLTVTGGGGGVLGLGADVSTGGPISVGVPTLVLTDSTVTANLLNANGSVTFAAPIESDAPGENAFVIDNSTAPVSVASMGATTALDSIAIDGLSVALGGLLQAQNDVSVTTHGNNDINHQGITSLGGGIYLNADGAIGGAPVLNAANGLVSLEADTGILVQTEAEFLEAVTDAGALGITEASGVTLAGNGLINAGTTPADLINLSAGGTINLANVPVSSAGGPVTIGSLAGDVLNADITSASSVLVSGVSLVGGTVTALGGPIGLNALGNVSDLGLNSAGDVIVNADFDVVNVDIANQGNVIIGGPGNGINSLLGSTIVTVGNVDLYVDRDIVNTNVDADGYVNAGYAGARTDNIRGSSFDADGQLMAYAGENIENSAFSSSAGAPLVLNAAGNIANVDVVAPNAEAQLMAGALLGPGAITGATVDALAATLTSMTGEIDTTQVVADNDVSAFAWSTVSGSTFISETGNVSVSGSGGNIVGTLVHAKLGLANLYAAIEIDATDVVALSDITATAVNDSISASSFTSTQGDLDITSGNDIVGSVFYAKDGLADITVGDEFDGNVVETMDAIDLTATWINGSTFVSEDGYVDIEATDGSIVAGSATSKTSYVEATASSADPLLGNITGLTVDASTTATMTASGSIVGGQSKSGSLADIDAGLVIDGLAVGSYGDIELDAGQDIVAVNATADGSIRVGLDGGAMNLVNSVLAGDDTVTVEVSDDVNNTKIAANDGITVTSGQSIVDTDMFTTGGDIAATATNLNIAGGSAIAETGSVDLDAGLHIDGTLVVAGDGSASLDAPGNLIAVDVTATEDINIGQTTTVQNLMNSTLAAGNDVFVDVNDDVHGTAIAAINDIDVFATDSIVGTSLLTTGGAIAAEASNGEIDQSDFAALLDITATAGDAIFDSSFVSEEGDLDIDAGTDIVGSLFYAKDGLADITVTDEFDGNTVETMDAIDLTATWINGSTFVSEDGYVNIAATVGDIVAGSATSKTDEVIATAAGNIDGLVVDAFTDVTLSAANILNGSATAKTGAALLTAGGYISNQDVNAATTVGLTAGSDVVGSSVLAGSDVTVGAVSLHTSDIVAGGSVLATLSEEMDGSTINALGAVGVGANNVTNSAVDADGTISVQALADITNSVFKSDVDGIPAIGLLAGGTVANVDVMATAGVVFINAGGEIDATNVQALDGMDILAGTGISASSFTSDLGPIFVETAGNVVGSVLNAKDLFVELIAEGEIDSTDVTAYQSILAEAGDAIFASSFVSESGDLDIEATAGDIVGSVFYAKDGLADITAGDEFDGSTIETMGDIVLDATWINGSTFVSEAGLVDLEATAGDIVAGSATSKTDEVIATASGNIDGLIIDAATDATLSAANILNGSATAQTGAAALTASAYISNQDVNAATTVGLSAGADVVGSSVLAGSDVTVDTVSLHTSDIVAGGLVDADLTEEMDGSTINALGAVTVDANNVTDSAVDADGLIDINALTNISNSSFKGDLAGAVAVDLDAGDSILNSDVATVNGAALLTATAGEIDAADVQALMDITATAGTSVSASSFTSETGAVTVTATADDIVGSVLYAKAGPATLSAGDEIDSTDVTADGLITATAADAISASSFTSESGDLDIEATAGDIVGSVLYAKSGAADILVGDEFDGNVVETMDAIDLTATWINGSTFVSEDGYVDIAATVGDIVAGSATSKTDDVTATAAGDISGLVVQASGTATLAAANPGGDIVGVTVNATTVSAAAGHDISGGTFWSGLGTTLTAGSDITGSVVDSGFASLAAVNDIVGATVDAEGGDVSMASSAGTIVGGEINAFGSADVDAAENIDGLIVEASDATLDATNILNGGVTATSAAGAGAVLTAAGYISNQDVNSATTANLTAGADVVGSSVLAASDVTVGAVSAHTTDIVSGGSVTATLSEELDGSAINALGNVSVSAANVTNSAVDNDGNLTLAIGQDVTNSIFKNDGSNAVVIGAGGSIVGSSLSATAAAANISADEEIDTTDVVALGSIVATAGTGISASSFTSEDGSILLDAVTGNIVGSDVNAKNGDIDIQVLAGELDTTDVVAFGDIDAAAQAGVSASSFTSEDGSILLGAVTGNIVGSDVNAKNGDIDIRVLAGELDTTDVVAFGDIDAGVQAGVSASSFTSEDGSILLVAVTGNIVGSDVNAKNGEAGINVQGGELDTTDVVAFGDIQAVAQAGVSASSFTSEDGSILLGALTGNIVGSDVNAKNGDVGIEVQAGELDATDVVAFGDIDAVAQAGVSASSFTSEDGSILLDAVTGNIVGSDVNAKNGDVGIEVQAGELDATDVVAFNTIEAFAQSGISASSFTSETEDLLITSGADIVGSVFYAKDGLADITVGDEFDGNVVETMAAIDLTATWINGSTFVSEDGYIDIAATVGDIVAGSATSKTDYVLATAAGNIDGLVVDAATNATLSADNILNGTVTAKTGFALLTAIDGYISNQDVTAGTSVSLSATEDVVGSSVLAGTTVDVSAVSLHTSDIVAGDDVLVSLLQEMDGSTINALGQVNVAANNVTNSAVDADDLITVLARENITNSIFKGDLNAPLAIDLTAGDALRGVNATAIAGGVALNAQAGEIDTTNVVALLDILATAGAGVSASSFTSETGNILATATTGNIVGTMLNAKTGSATVEATLGELDDVHVTADQTVTAIAGDAIFASSFVSENGSLSIDAGADIVGSDFYAKNGRIVVNGGDHLMGQFDGNTVVTLGDIILDATWINGSTFVSEAGLVDIEATVGDIVAGSATSKTSSVTATAASDIDGLVVDAATDAALVATAGNIVGGDVLAGATASLTAGTDVDSTNVLAAGAVTATADQSITNANLTSTGSTVDATATNMDINGVSIAANDTATLSAGEDILNTDATSETSNVVLSADGDVIAADTTAATTVDYTVFGDVLNGSATAGGDITAGVNGRLVNWLATTDGGDEIRVLGAGVLNWDDPDDALGVPVVSAYGSIDGGVFTADTVTLYKADGIGANDQVRIAGAETVELLNTTTGGINVTNTNVNSTTLEARAYGSGDLTFNQTHLDGRLTVSNAYAEDGDLIIRSDDDTTTERVRTDNGDLYVEVFDGELVVNDEGVYADNGEIKLIKTGDQDVIDINADVVADDGPIMVDSEWDVNLDENAEIRVDDGEDPISIKAGDDIRLDGSVITATSTVTLEAGDEITDETDSDTRIVANTLTILGAEQVGEYDVADPINPDVRWLDTEVEELNIFGNDDTPVGRGDVSINEWDDIYLRDVELLSGVGSRFSVVTGEDTDAGTIRLGSVKSVNGRVYLTAADRIVDRQDDGSAFDPWEGLSTGNIDITAGEVELRAVNGIGIRSNGSAKTVELDARLVYGETTADDAHIRLVNVSDQNTRIHLYTDGADANISYEQKGTGDLTVSEAFADEGSVFLSTEDSDMGVWDVFGEDDVELFSMEDIMINPDGEVEAEDGRITIAAMGNFYMADESSITANGITAFSGDVKVDITGSNVVLEYIEALGDEAGVNVTALNGSITAEYDDEPDFVPPIPDPDYGWEIVTDDGIVMLEAVTGIGTNPVTGRVLDTTVAGVAGALDVDSASMITANTTGDNGGIYIDAFNGPLSVYASTLGEDADIILNYEDGGPLTLASVTAQNGDVVVNSNQDIHAEEVYALDAGEVTGVVDDAHFVWLTATNGRDVFAYDIVADYYVQIDAFTGGSDIGIAAGGIDSGGSVLLNAGCDIYDLNNSATTNITAEDNIRLMVGGQIGEPGEGDPLEVSAGGLVEVGVLNGAACFGGYERKKLWAFINGESASGNIDFVGPGSTAPGIVLWNGIPIGGPGEAMHRIWSGLMMPVNQTPLHLNNYLHDYPMYFPHSYMSLPTYPDYLPLEVILHGGSVIEGLPEGVEPSAVEINEIDDTLSWHWKKGEEQLEKEAEKVAQN